MRLTDVQWWSSQRESRGGQILTLLAVLVAILAPAGPAAAAAPATLRAAAPSQCTRSAGVLVVVDFQHWGDPVDRGCAASPKTGLDALFDAGYSVTGTAQYGDDFICRLDGLPTAKQQSCQSTPPASAYWAYFHAQPGQNTWQYSSSGASGYDPAAGSIEAWTFGSGTPPTFTPAQVRAGSVSTTTTTTTTTTTSTTTTTVPATTTTTRAPTTTTTRKDTPESTTTTTRRDSHPKAKVKRGPKHKAAAHFPKHAGKQSATTTPPTTALKVVNVAGGATKASAKDGSPVGLIVGLCVALAVAGVAVVTAVRRRRSAG